MNGVRGDFVDYRGLREVANRPNWSIEVFPTGAMPHFEMTAQFVRHYDVWAGRTESTKMSDRYSLDEWSAQIP